MTDTSSLDWLSKVAETRGETGVLLVVLFKTIKSELQTQLKRAGLSYDEEELNQYSLQMARKLAATGRSEPSRSEVRELLQKISNQTQSK